MPTSSASKGQFDKLKSKEIRTLARKSVGVFISAKAMGLKHTIHLIQLLDSEIAEIEQQIQSQVQDSPVTTIPGITFRMAAMIQAEIGDFNRFSSPDKILVFAGLSPTTYQSGNFVSSNVKMAWQSLSALRPLYLYSICQPLVSYFQELLPKETFRREHFFVALSHAKLILIIYHRHKTEESFQNFS